MKKCRLWLMLIGLTLMIPGCGFNEEGENYTVTVSEATPTPEPTATPIPTPEATPTPAPVIEVTTSGVQIEKVEGVYYALDAINLRADCSTEADVMFAATLGQELRSTGISVDRNWVEVNIDGYTYYANAQYVSTTPPQ